jgi:hypothetical protein
MKKFLSLFILFTVAGATLMAQPKAKAKAKTPVVKTKVTIKPTTPPSAKPVNMDIDFKTDEAPYSYAVQKGDQFVYHVNAGGSEYDFIVTINKFSYENGIDFDYTMTNDNQTSGHVVISPTAKDKARDYINYFRGGDLNLTNSSSVWLSYSTFMDMPKKKTVMSFDGGAKTNMYRPANDEVVPVVKVKGVDRKIDAFMINSAADGTGDKTLWIHGSSSNPLIIKMDLGFQIELKEIR